MSVSAFRDLLLKSYGWATKSSMSQFCDIETAEIFTNKKNNKSYLSHVCVTKDGGFVSVLQLMGSAQAMGEKEREEAVAQLDSRLRQFFVEKGRSLQFYYVRDPNLALDVISKHERRSKKIAELRGLRCESLIDAQVNQLTMESAGEATYLAVYTSPGILSKREIADNKNTRQQDPQISSGNGQGFNVGIELMLQKHVSFYDTLRDGLKAAGQRVKQLSVASQMRAIQKSVYPSRDNRSWTPALPLDTTHLSASDTDGDLDGSAGALPSIAEQLFITDSYTKDDADITIGDDRFAAFDMLVAPKYETSFYELVHNISGRDPKMPWRVSFKLAGDGLRFVGFKNLIAVGSNNAKITQALKWAKETKMHDGTAFAAMQCNVATWAPKDDLATLKARRDTLLYGFQSWQEAQLCEVAADPLEATLSSALALSTASTASAAIPTTAEALALMPIDRPSLPFKDGVAFFNTEDDLIVPFQTGSSDQPQGLELYFAKPRKGKSVLLNTINLGFILAATGEARETALPPCMVLDIGDSGKGMVDYLRAVLPASRQHEVLYEVPENAASKRVNVFDIPLGLKRPLPIDLSTIRRLVSLACGDFSSDKDGLLSKLIDRAYDFYANPANAKLYRSGIDGFIDEALADHGIDLDGENEWWDIRDKLFEKGLIREASLAQRYAVPMLTDLSLFTDDPEIKNLYGSITTGNGEPLIEHVVRKLSEAVSLYPVLSDTSTFDLGDSRVRVFNLAKVCPKGDDIQTQRQRTLMYLVFRQLMVGEYYACSAVDDDLFTAFDPGYQSYQQKRLTALRGIQKRVIYEEFHRTEGAESTVRDQVISDVREGPKCGVQIALVSQDLCDFPEKLVRMANAAFILQGGDREYVDEVVNRFQFNHAARDILRFKLHKPGQMLMYLATNHGIIQRYCENRLSGFQLWVLTTTAEDITLRNALVKKVGVEKALHLLSREYPQGTAKHIVEARKLDETRIGGGDIIDALVEEMLSHAFS